MEFLKGLVVALVVLVFIASAEAGELAGNDALYRKLVEKGVLTEDEVNELRSDQHPRLELGGRFEYAYRNSEASGPVGATSAFQFRSVRLETRSQISPYAFLEVDPEFTNSSATHLESAYIAFFSGDCELKLGQHHVPANLETMSSDKYIAFTERNLTSSLSPARQLGASWQQYLLDHTVWYQVGLFNGFVSNGSLANNRFNPSANSTSPYKIYGINNTVVGYSNDNTGLMYAARLEWHPWGNIGSGIKAKQENFTGQTGLAFGAAYYKSDDTATTAAKSAITGSDAWDFDLRWRRGGLDAKANYTIRNVNYLNANSTQAVAAQGGYTVQASYLIHPKFSLAMRFDALTVDGNNVITGPDGEKTDRWETVGVNWYLKGHSLKLQADYIMKQETTQAGVTYSPNTFIGQVVYSF